MSTTVVQVLVDGVDPRVLYSGTGWESGNGVYEYKTTGHGSITGRKASLSFTFNGTSVGVFATIPEFEADRTPPVVACKVDGTTIPSFPRTSNPGNTALHYYLQCDSTSTPLSSTDEHELVVEVDSPDVRWWLDYITYESEVDENVLVAPGVNSPVQVVVDEADTTRVELGPPGAWSRGGPPERSDSTHFTTSGGATATYKFYGTGIEVYGMLGAEHTRDPFTATFAIDGSNPSTYISPTEVDYRWYTTPMNLYSTATLQEGEHTFVVTYTSDRARTMYLDSFVYTITPSSLLTAPVLESSPDEGSQVPTDADGSAKTPPPTGQVDESEPTNEPNVAAIAGVAAGAAIFLILVLGGLFIFLRKRTKQRKNLNQSLCIQKGESSGHLAPGEGSSLLANHSTSPASLSASSASYGVQQNINHHGAPYTESTSSVPHLRVPATPPRQHTDGGVSLASGDDDSELSTNSPEGHDDLPPAYKPSYR